MKSDSLAKLSAREYFDMNVPIEVQEEIVRTVFSGYRKAYDTIVESDYKAPQVKDLYPYARRAMIDSHLSQLPARVPHIKSVESVVNRNVARNSHHTLLVVGNIVLTASAVPSPSELPRESIFRQAYANPQSQFCIDDDNMLMVLDKMPLPSEQLYAIITHGPFDRGAPHLPGFIRIVFPDRLCVSRIDDDIDLCIRCSDFVKKILQADTEVVTDEALPKLIGEVPIQEKLL